MTAHSVTGLTPSCFEPHTDCLDTKVVVEVVADIACCLGQLAVNLYNIGHKRTGPPVVEEQHRQIRLALSGQGCAVLDMTCFDLFVSIRLSDRSKIKC